MRYRIWDTTQLKYIEEIFLDQVFLRQDGKVFWYSHAGFEDVTSRMIVEPFIGLKEFYVGDIVYFKENEALPSFVGVIEYEPLKSAYWIHNPKTESAFYLWDANRESVIKILGNVHKDAELLK